MLAVFLRILAIFLVFAVGFALRRRNVVDDAFCRQLSVVLTSVFYPCLILNTVILKLSLPELARLWILPTGAGLTMLLGWGVGLIVRHAWRGLPMPRQRMLHFQCLMNNYSFLPLMLAASLWGERGAALVVFSTLGPELVLWTFGVQTLTGRPIRRDSLRHLFSMPMLAMGLAVAVLAVEAGLPTLGSSVVQRVGDMLLYTCGLAGQATIPVCGLIAGMRMASMRTHHLFSPAMAAVVALRLLVVPGLAIAALLALPVPREVRDVLIVVATMPVALVGVPLAEVYGGDSEFAAAGVLVTHLACLATIPLWLSICGIG